MTPEDELNIGIREAFQPLIDALERPIQFSFHSATTTEDGKSLLVLFEGDDGHDYACSIPLGERIGQQAHLCRVD